MVSEKTKYGAAGLGGGGILIALSSGAEPLTAVVAGALALAGGLDPSFAQAVSIVANSMPAAGFASTSLDFQPLTEALPLSIIKPAGVAILIVAVALVITESQDDD